MNDNQTDKGITCSKQTSNLVIIVKNVIINENVNNNRFI